MVGHPDKQPQNHKLSQYGCEENKPWWEETHIPTHVFDL